MISKIIQKEKERQEEYFKTKDKIIALVGSPKLCSDIHKKNLFAIGLAIEEHRQSLINLKEYMEEKEEFLDNLNGSYGDTEKLCIYCRVTAYTTQKGIVHKDDCIILQLRADIKELTKMIERYK